jgi:hypothetical protein
MLFSDINIESVIFSKIKHRKTNLSDIGQLVEIESGMNVIIVGLPDKYKDEVNKSLKNVKFIDRNQDFNPELLDNTYLILLSKMNHNYALSYKVECLANKKRIQVGKLIFDEDSTTIGHISEAAMYDFAF